MNKELNCCLGLFKYFLIEDSQFLNILQMNVDIDEESKTDVKLEIKRKQYTNNIQYASVNIKRKKQ
ncbi:hypothetical protein pb186bvf_017699 [Paramecium bursaria]